MRVCVSREAVSKRSRSSHIFDRRDRPAFAFSIRGSRTCHAGEAFLLEVGYMHVRGVFLFVWFGRSPVTCGAGWPECERADEIRPLSCPTAAFPALAAAPFDCSEKIFF
jgi:hypothetical protein